MSNKYHYLKTEAEYFQAVKIGLKKFEIRKNDRDFQVGDVLFLQETVGGVYTGRRLAPRKIKYIFSACKYGLRKDHCILAW